MTNKNTLENISHGTDNNLNLVRLIAALMVMYMHSLALSHAVQHEDVMNTLTFGRALSGQVGVDIFFVISGFLIYRSYERNNNIGKYFKARFLRIWPLLAVFIIVSALIYGPLITTVSTKEYFTDVSFRKYLLNLVFVSGKNHLPGVFDNHINQSANGSVWTLQYEVICYLLVVVFYPLFNKYKKSIFGTIAVSAFVYLFATYYLGNASGVAANMGRLTLQFQMGAMYYIYRDKIIMSWKIMLGLLAVMIPIMKFFDFEMAFAIGGAYLIMYIGFHYFKISKYYNRVGDISYGVYILSFFVQQRVIDYMGKIPYGYRARYMDPYVNFGVSLLIVLPLALISWHCFEKQLLKLKK